MCKKMCKIYHVFCHFFRHFLRYYAVMPINIGSDALLGKDLVANFGGDKNESSSNYIHNKSIC